MLALALFFMGAVNGLVQVSMNAQAIALEARYGRTILSKMHGGFSVGMMAGALVASLVAHLGVSYRTHLLGVSALLLFTGIGIGFFLIETERVTRAHRRRIRLSLALTVIVVVSFFELFCEGTATSWSAVYAHKVGSSAALAALTFSLYSLTMTVGRLRGDHLVMRMGVGGRARALVPGAHAVSRRRPAAAARGARAGRSSRRFLARLPSRRAGDRRPIQGDLAARGAARDARRGGCDGCLVGHPGPSRAGSARLERARERALVSALTTARRSQALLLPR